MRKKKLRASDRLKTSASHVTQVQSCNTSANYKKRPHAFKISFVLTFWGAQKLCKLLATSSSFINFFRVLQKS